MAFSAMRRLSCVTTTPWAFSRAISSISACGSSTTPLPITESLFGLNHTGRQERQLVGDAIDDKRMAGVMAALEANDDVGLFRQPVDDLALAFVAPLRADHHHVRHSEPFPQVQPSPAVASDAGGIPATASEPNPCERMGLNLG